MKAKLGLYVAWVQSVVAMVGSLYFSEILQFPPCVLCWYQRISFYPLVFLLAAGIFRNDRGIVWYTAPLAIVGWLIAIYHNLLYYKLIPESAAPCLAGVSCTTEFIEWFGFITIPFLSLVGFTIVLAGIFWYWKHSK